MAGDVVLLPHAHAARVWRQEHTSAAIHADPQPSILAWSEWTAALWAKLLLEGADDRVLLNRLQEQHIWTEILNDHLSPGSVSPVALTELAQLARSGLQRAAAWRILGDLSAAADTPDARHFAHWVSTFLRRCEAERLLPAALLEQALAQHLRANALHAPPRIFLAGFGHTTPAQSHLLQALTSAGSHVQTLHASKDSGGEVTSTAVLLPSEAEELRFAVRLIAQRARAGTARSFALISPDIEKQRPSLEPLFRELLAPELASVSADLSSTPWFASGGVALRSHPAILTLLHLLQWADEALALEHIETVLASPFLALDLAPTHLARLRRDLRRGMRLRPGLPLSVLVARLRHTGSTGALSVLGRLQQEIERSQVSTARRSHADWAEHIRRWLRIVGWPGPRTPSPAEFQVFQAWDALLDRVATLGIHNIRVQFRSMLALLVAEAERQQISAANPLAPVHLLSLPEAEGLNFDLAIVLGASDEHLPAPEPRHPLLSQALQRSLGLGDSARDLQLCADALGRLGQSCLATIYLASPAGEGQEVQLSPLVQALRATTAEPEELLPPEFGDMPAVLEATPEQPLPPLQSFNVPRGVEVLSLQAACGFRAFTSLRLSAEEPIGAELGLNMRDSGTVLHDALQIIWQELGDQDSLRALSSEERRTISARAAGAALAHPRLQQANDPDDPWNARMRDVLEQRFTTLLSSWLEEELKRAPFRILAQEQEQNLTLGPIHLTFRRDRVDAVEGGIALVDYKTSSTLRCEHWLDERPEAPQLPAYALALDDPESLRGIAFAQIRPGQKQSGWISLSDEEKLFPKNAANRVIDLAGQLDQWRAELTSLAQAYASGDARVNPKSYPKTCQYCTYRSLCRLNPATLLDQAAEDNESTEEETPHG